MPPQIVHPSGSVVDAPICDDMSIGDARSSIAESLNVLRARVKLLSADGVIQDDADSVATLGERATLVLVWWEPWDLAPFECSFGDSVVFHPEPQIGRDHGFPHTMDDSQTLHVRAMPKALISWEDFCAEHRSEWMPRRDVEQLTGAQRLADFIWGLGQNFGLAGLLRPDDAADRVRALLRDGIQLDPSGRFYARPTQEPDARQRGRDFVQAKQAELEAKLQALLPLLERRGTFGSVLFPDALEPIVTRLSFGDESDKLELLATTSYFWCVNYSDGSPPLLDDDLNPYFG